jgi:hypothetical protein
MSVLGFDALGHLALGNPGASKYINLAASSGLFSLAGKPANEIILEADPPGQFALIGVSALFSIVWPNARGEFAVTGAAAPLTIAKVIFAETGAFVLTGSAAIFARDFVNWLPGPFAGETWSATLAPFADWSGASSQASSWNNARAPAADWSSRATPSHAWTVDPAQVIPPPVSE